MARIEISGLPPEKAERLARVLEKIADNADSLEDMLDALSKFRETGALAGFTALAEGFEEGFNYLMRPEVMGSIGNMMILVYLMSRLNHAMLFETANNLPPCVSKAYEEFKNTPKKKAGFFELLDLIRSPEFYSMLKALRSMIECMQDKNRQR